MSRKMLLHRVGLVFVGLLGSIVIGEGVLRIWTPDFLLYKAVRRSDLVFHHSLIPSSHYIHHDQDFIVDVRTNSLGFRDREHTDDPPVAERLLVLGDSFVEGYGVPMESCFVHRLEMRLNGDSGRSRPTMVFNLGVAGNSPIIEYLVLKQKGLPLKPDVVILCYDMTDVQEDFLYAADAEFDSTGAPVRVHSSWPSFGGMMLLPRGSWKTYLQEKSYLYTSLSYCINLFKPRPLYEEGNILAGTYMHTVDSTSERWARYFDHSLSYVRMIADLCRSRGIRFILVTYPRGNQVNSSEWVSGRRYWGLDSLVHNSAIFPFLQSFADRQGIPFLNMTRVFRARSKGDLYYPHDGHWTSAGHALAADTLYDFLTVNRLM